MADVLTSNDSMFAELMLRAYETAQCSLDPSTQLGALLIEPSGIEIRGFNHFPKGVPDDYWHDREKKYAHVIHAEMTVIMHSRGTKGSTLVCPWAACTNCAKHIIEAGVSRLVRHSYEDNGIPSDSHWYEDVMLGDEILRLGGVEIVEIPVVDTDIRVRRNGSLWPTTGGSNVV